MHYRHGRKDIGKGGGGLGGGGVCVLYTKNGPTRFFQWEISFLPTMVTLFINGVGLLPNLEPNLAEGQSSLNKQPLCGTPPDPPPLWY